MTNNDEISRRGVIPSPVEQAGFPAHKVISQPYGKEL